ncbi:MAG TPA: tryptophan synthase subunit alpha, partial [Mycobacteriales bacterium]
DRFAADLAEGGVSGVITPDLIPEEAGSWLEATTARGIDPVFLVAPSSTDARIVSTAAVTRGFIYAASTMGVTGARTSVAGGAHALVDRVRRHTDLPVAVGLGVSTGSQAAEVAAYADGVIVGSALVRCLLDTPGPAGIVALRSLVRELADGVRSARRRV